MIDQRDDGISRSNGRVEAPRAVNEWMDDDKGVLEVESWNFQLLVIRQQRNQCTGCAVPCEGTQ
jgi:hypothetical protein